MEHADLIIRAGWIIPVEPGDAILESHALIIRDGTIAAIVPNAETDAISAEHVVDRPDHALIPGLVNAHTHAAMSLLRGLADDLPLMKWLSEHVWPAEQAHMSAEFVHAGAELAVVEMLRGGTTCFSDMYFFPEVTGRVVSRAGLRAILGMIVFDFPSAYGEGAEDYLNKGLELHDAWRNDPLVSTVFAPHAPYTVSEPNLERIRTLADELDLPVHMHVHETAHEVADSVEKSGGRPLARLDALGLVSPSLIAVHMTQVLDDEIRLLADKGVSVVHCPESNLKLASGFCPVQRLLDEGVNVAIGTDGAASNNDLDMIGEMRTAALLGKGIAGDAAALPAATVLRMATLNGARALGQGDRIGSLEVGKEADVVAVDLSRAATQPIYNPLSQIVYAASRDQVSDVWVAGRHLLSECVPTTADADAALRQARRWRDRICSTL